MLTSGTKYAKTSALCQKTQIYNEYTVKYSTELTSLGRKCLKLNSLQKFVPTALKTTQAVIFMQYGTAHLSNNFRKKSPNHSVFLGCHIPLSPSLCLLGDTSTTNLNRPKNVIILTSLTIAKKTILMNWKSRNNTNTAQWKNLLIDHISLEYLSSPIRHTAIAPLLIWSPLISFLQT